MKLSQTFISLATFLLLTNATNPNENLDGSLKPLPQAPVPEIAESATYNAAYNIMAVQGHNSYRRAHQVCDMKFSVAAAEGAQQWAEKMAAEGRMYHSKYNERSGCGENLAMHSNTNFISTTNIATQMWYDEVTNPGYDFNNQGFGMGTGHFTQVVWKGSTELGCGVSGVYVACRYCKRAGNMMGAFEQNVFPKGKEATCDAQKASTEGTGEVAPVKEFVSEATRIKQISQFVASVKQDEERECYPQGRCFKGYMDTMRGRSNWWGCARDCPGGIHMADNVCGCACIKLPKKCNADGSVNENVPEGANATGFCANYRGDVSKTVDGYTCQKWSAQAPWRHNRTPKEFPDAGLGDHNHCRNPDNEPSIWCFTNSSRHRWGLCEPTNLSECGDGTEKQGHEMVQENGQCTEANTVGGIHKIGKLDKCKYFCQIVQKQFNQINGYWFKQGGTCACCSSTEGLEELQSVNTYSLPTMRADKGDGTDEQNEQWKVDREMDEYENKKADFEAEEEYLDEQFAMADAELEETAKELAKLFTPNQALVQTGCCGACNRRRRSCGCRPARLSTSVCSRCQGFCNNIICEAQADGRRVCRTKTGADLKGLFKPGQRRRRLEETGEKEECHQSMWENPDPSTETTAEKAIDAWYSYEKYYDHETGTPKEGFEKEAFEYLNVINTETTEVGFGIVEHFVIGYYCPKASTDPKVLMKTTPKVRQAPTTPTIPEGFTLKTGAACPKLGDTGLRPPCTAGLCCGKSQNADFTKTFDQCRDSAIPTYQEEDESWTFQCHENAKNILMSVGTILISIALTI